MKHKFMTLFLLLIVGLFLWSSCIKEEKYTDGSLTFSEETISFDTIFTSMGSITLSAKIYNPHKEAVFISSVRLCGGSNSCYRINIDGDTNLTIANVSLGAGDSMFVFVKVTINPTESGIPFIIEDSIAFTIGSQTQFLKMRAFGQNAYFHLPNENLSLPNGEKIQGFYAGCSTPWKSDKPHVIIGTCLIQDSILIIEPGTKIFFGGTGQIMIGEKGSLIMEGIKSNPITLSSIRNDIHILTKYSELPGQWKGIRILNYSLRCKANWVILKNGIYGFKTDSLPSSTLGLEISNTYIQNMSEVGIHASGAHVKGENILFSKCKDMVRISSDGIYDFINCSFINFWGEGDDLNYRKKNEAGISIFQTAEEKALQVSFTNCLIWGNNPNELNIKVNPSASILFQNNLIKTQDTSASYYMDCLFNQTPIFINKAENNFRPAFGSPVIGNGSEHSISKEPFDLDSISRPKPPSIGAFDFAKP